jgi:hypothetical protein
MIAAALTFAGLSGWNFDVYSHSHGAIHLVAAAAAAVVAIWSLVLAAVA